MLIMLIGIPASGKTTYAENYKNQFPDTVILSSDSIREELYGDPNIQGSPNKIFGIMKERMASCLKNGNTVIYDATNVKVRDRESALRKASDMGVCSEAVYFCTSLKIALKRNEDRDRKVPEHVIRRMYFGLEPPKIQEGFKEIKYIYA